MKAWMQDQLGEIRRDPGMIAVKRQKSKVDDSPSSIKEFEGIYSAIMTLVEEVKLLDRCDPSWCPFSLSHPERSPRNIMMDINDPSQVIALIDWEGARIKPWVSSRCR
jgi:hypothetical protein